MSKSIKTTLWIKINNENIENFVKIIFEKNISKNNVGYFIEFVTL